MGQTPGECMPRLITLFDLCALKAWAAQHTLSPYSPQSDPTESWIESSVLGSLSRVHFVSCSGTLQFLASAHCAKTLIKSEQDMSAIIIDCLSAFQVLSNFHVASGIIQRFRAVCSGSIEWTVAPASMADPGRSHAHSTKTRSCLSNTFQSRLTLSLHHPQCSVDARHCTHQTRKN